MMHISSDTITSIGRLRVVRKYLDRPIDAGDLEAITEAARWTGSAKNRQPWTLIVITEPDQRARLAECGSFTRPLLEAPLVIAPVKHPDGYDWDMGRIAQNMMLAAAAVGVGSCPITLHDEECGRRVLAIPDDHRCQVVIAFGYPDENPERRMREASPMSGRKPAEELLRYERWIK